MRERRLVELTCVLLATLYLALAPGAVAQNPPDGGPNPKAWELEAKAVAMDLALSPELTNKLVDAYKAARQSHMSSVRAKMAQVDGKTRNFSAFREVNQAEKTKLEGVLKGFLNPDQTKAAAAILGTFSRRWDPMVIALDGMALDEKVKAQALKLVSGFVLESDKVLQATASDGDFKAVREQTRALKEKLDAEMAKLLSSEQMTKWTEMSVLRPGRRPPRDAAVPQLSPERK